MKVTCFGSFTNNLELSGGFVGLYFVQKLLLQGRIVDRKPRARGDRVPLSRGQSQQQVNSCPEREGGGGGGGGRGTT